MSRFGDEIEQPDPLLRAEAAEALLKEALEFFNDHPNFQLSRDPQRYSYGLASKIDRHFREYAE